MESFSDWHLLCSLTQRREKHAANFYHITTHSDPSEKDTLAPVNPERTFQAGTKRTAPTLQSTFFKKTHFQYLFKHTPLDADVSKISYAVSPTYQRTISTCTSHLFRWFVLLSGKVIFQMKCSALCPLVQYSTNHLSWTALAHNRLCLVKQKNMDFLSIVSSCLITVLWDQKSTAISIWLPAQNQLCKSEELGMIS